MEFANTDLPGVMLILPKVFEDSRGFFFESFNLKKFQALTGETYDFVQDNHSKSEYGVIRAYITSLVGLKVRSLE